MYYLFVYLLIDQSCFGFKQLLKKSFYLTELYLHYNNINSVGGAQIFNGLYKNSNLKVLDLSYNSLQEYSSTSISESVLVLTKVITKPHPKLTHLDISHNKFNQQDSVEISKALLENHIIYGFHYEGNALGWIVDEEGFLIQPDILKEIEQQEKLTEYMWDPSLKQIKSDKLELYVSVVENLSIGNYSKRIDSLKAINLHYKKEMGICWICNGYQQVKFSWNTQTSGSIDSEPVYIHLDFENYKPILMVLGQDENYYHEHMCPPQRKVHYFFSNPVTGFQTIAKDQLICDIDLNNAIQPKYLYYDEQIHIQVQEMDFLNYTYTGIQQDCINGQNIKVYQFYQKCKQKKVEPRIIHPKYDLSFYFNCKRYGWSIEKSIFAHFHPENDALIEECFKFDFKSSKIPKLINENEINQVFETLIDFYPYLFNAYKYYASSNIISGVIYLINICKIPSINFNSLMEFIGHTKILDGINIRQTDLDVNFITSNGKDLNYSQIQDKALVRYQFLEILVRISLDKFYKTGQVQTQNEAISKLIDEDEILTWLMEFDSAQLWRDERFWNEQCDLVIKRLLPFIKGLFQYASMLNPKRKKSAKYSWISAFEFKEFINQVDIIGPNLNEKEVNIAFLYGMITQVDELNNQRHFQMNLYEFIEAFCRIAEKISLTPFQNNSQLEEKETYSDRIMQPLHIKIEGLFLFIYYKKGSLIKKCLEEIQSETLAHFDSCILGKKRGKINQLINPKIQKRLELETLASKRMSFTIDQADDSSESSIVDINQEQIFLTSQFEEIQSTTNNKDIYQTRRKGVRLQFKLQIKENFTIVTAASYLKLKELKNIYNQK